MNLFLVLGAGAIGLGALHLRTVKAAAEPQSAQLIAAKATIPSAPTASPKLPAPGTALYETHRGDTVISVARRTGTYNSRDSGCANRRKVRRGSKRL